MISVGFYRTLGVLLFLGGCALVALNGYATWLQGSTWAVTDGGKFIAKSTAVTIEIVGVVVIGFAAGAAWSGGRRWIGFFLGVIMLVSGVNVVNSVASFRATERMSASMTRGAAIDRVAEADKLQKESAKKTLDYAGKARSGKAREDFISANKEAIKSFREAPVEVRIAPDAGAELWATAFGFTAQRVQMLLSALEAFWQVVLSMVCFPAAGFFMNPLSWMKVSGDKKLAGSPEGSGGKDKSTVALRGENVVDLPTKVAAPPQLQAAPEPVPTVSSEALRVAAPAPKTVSLSLEPKEYASVEEFLAANPSVSKQKDIAAGMKVSEGKVSRDIKRLKGRGKVKADRNGRSIAVTYTPRRNGGLHALA
jgi:uncharacterized membrane protein